MSQNCIVMRMSGSVERGWKAKAQTELERGCTRHVQAAGVSPIVVIFIFGVEGFRIIDIHIHF